MDKTQPPRRLVRAEAVLARRRRGITVVLDDVHDRHNVSAVLRTCEAFGIQDVHVVESPEDTAKPNRGVTLGADRWLTLTRHPSAGAAIAALRAAGYALRVGCLHPDAVPLPQVPRADRAAYVFGNEHAGVDDLWLREADTRFVIPTCGFGGSLNVSVAAALTLYDRLLGTARIDLPPGDLDPDERHALRERWYARLAHGSDELRRAYAAWLEHPPTPQDLFPRDTHRKGSR